MKKTLLTLTTLAIIGTSFQANAIVGGITSFFAAGVGIPMALVGLGIDACVLHQVVETRGKTCMDFDEATTETNVFYLLVGTVLLDGENGRSLDFQEFSTEKLIGMGLNKAEAQAYNNNTGELSEALKVVSSQLSKDSTVEDSKKLWQEQANILGEDAINGARKVLAFNAN
jgi:hypothetical protein